jgi:UMF1 family MFS transporter
MGVNPFSLDSVAQSDATAAIWWAGFTLIPFLRLSHHQPMGVVPESGGMVRQSFGQLAATLRDLRHYPMALTFLLAYLFFNDGIQTVIAASAVYGSEELGHSQTILIATILMVQFVAFGGALLFGRLATSFGAKRVILTGLLIWMAIVTIALVLPAGNVPLFLALGVGIGIVLGGTQALARSYFSLLIPRGKEAEYFGFYHAMDRGTSWFGTATMAVVLSLTESYRPAIFALVVFFALGFLLLLKVDTARGVREAGNAMPTVI